jgi:predicted dehydrogenase
MAREAIRWGILSTGGIAHQFARDLQLLPDAELVAVGSRRQKTADAFAREFNVPHSHASYEALAEDPDVDVVYVATPHPFHAENSILLLRAGKAVLCEKPFTMNAEEARRVIEVAEEEGLFLMEAMWMRFIPAIVTLRQYVEGGMIGEVRAVEANLGFRPRYDPKSRLFNPELGGGALLDLGVYPISFAFMVLGPPETVTSTAHLGETGVDEQSAYLFRYADGAIASLYATFQARTPNDGVVTGTTGRVRVPDSLNNPTCVTLQRQGEEEQTVCEPRKGQGYQYEAEEVMRCMREGRLESETMSWEESLAIMRTMDEIRGQWGLAYPGETRG